MNIPAHITQTLNALDTRIATLTTLRNDLANFAAASAVIPAPEEPAAPAIPAAPAPAPVAAPRKSAPKKLATPAARSAAAPGRLPAEELRRHLEVMPTPFQAEHLAEKSGLTLSTAYSALYRSRQRGWVENMGAGLWRVTADIAKGATSAKASGTAATLAALKAAHPAPEPAE